MVLVIKRERPETFDGRQCAAGKRDGVAVAAVQLPTIVVEILIKILRFIWCVDENVRLGDGDTRK